MRGQKQLKGEGIGVRTHVLLAFLMALIFYLLAYSVDRYFRVRRGPWIVTFSTDSNDVPAIGISQTGLAIDNVKITFVDERLAAPLTRTNVVFDSPLKQPAFGAEKFHDLTFLPGTLTFDLFGHEIELIPRVLYIDKKQFPWRSNLTIALSKTNAPQIQQ